MKILYIISSLSIGGAEVLLQRTANLIAERHRVTILYLRGDGKLRHFIDDRITVEDVGWGLKGFLKTKRLIKLINPDVVHSHLLPADLYLLLLFPIYGGNVFTTIHNIGKGKIVRDWISARIYKLLELCYGGRHKFICISEAVLSYMLRTARLKKGSALVVYNGIPDPKENDRLERGKDLRLLFVGRLVEQKNPILALMVMERLIEKRSNVSLTIVGDGPLRPIMEGIVDKCGLNDVVSIVGEADTVDSFYLESDVLLITSEIEGFSLVAVEAMSYGVCVLARPVGGLIEIIDHGLTGFHCRDTLEFVEAVQKLDRGEWDIEVISRRSKEKVINEFNLRDTVEGLLKIYER